MAIFRQLLVLDQPSRSGAGQRLRHRPAHQDGLHRGQAGGVRVNATQATEDNIDVLAPRRPALRHGPVWHAGRGLCGARQPVRHVREAAGTLADAATGSSRRPCALDATTGHDGHVMLRLPSWSTRSPSCCTVMNSVEHWLRTRHVRGPADQQGQQGQGAHACGPAKKMMTKKELNEVLENGMDDTVRDMVANGEAARRRRRKGEARVLADDPGRDEVCCRRRRRSNRF